MSPRLGTIPGESRNRGANSFNVGTSFFGSEVVCGCMRRSNNTRSRASAQRTAADREVILGTKFVEAMLLVRDRNLQIPQQMHLLLTVFPSDGANVRCTYHVPRKNLWRQERLVQAFDYVGDQGGGGRSFDALRRASSASPIRQRRPASRISSTTLSTADAWSPSTDTQKTKSDNVARIASRP
jgi:hypothetical protein